MKIFIDSANVNDIREAVSLGVIDGVTTNPTLVAKEKRPAEELLKEICGLLPGPVSAEVISMDAAGMVREAQGLVKIAPNIVIKIPLIKEGLKAVKILSEKKIRTNVTLCFSASQALLAAKAGASFISPFIGRLDDISQTGMELIADIKQIYSNYSFKTEIIVASVRNPVHVVDAAKIGADIATVPFAVIEQLLRHPLTDIGVARFLEDYTKIPQK
ncbi:MAG TPA: fructose-6-phosphate aldolase [Candidatus Omnitrophota bacterium]|nr:fructose-6-phosphate aldolase [Candidatus Omnitrophota bacterium]HNQ50201.1 fructose-6-phosphate aldolase [Candidatus Omnitrophota bacterium]HQO38721.1 fructose-6-phosphate aldolase [Candidatus Omnitrophota bacterium]HQQ06930.1 fructose-6-phosphate aldolase [Candidatus Omnitrophota bacterium]